MQRGTLDRDGLRLSVAKTGSGPALVFQHGLCGAASQPAEVFPDIGWQCLTLECRGHGLSQAGDAAAFSIATFAEDVAAMIALRGGPVVLGGISMGAAIALRLAVTRPDLLRGLVLARPAWLFDAGPENMRPNAEVGGLLRVFPAAEAQSRFEASATAARLGVEAPDNLASLRGFFAREPLAVTAELLCRISADGPDITHVQAAALKIPTLVIGTRRDAIHPFEYAQKLAAIIPAAHLVEITPKATSPARYRAEFSAAIATFLKEF